MVVCLYVLCVIAYVLYVLCMYHVVAVYVYMCCGVWCAYVVLSVMCCD